jgi:hypothetical protein
LPETSRTGSLLEGFLSILALPVLFGPGIVVWQIITWLRTARWKPVPVADVLAFFDIPYPRFQWLGIQKITDSVLDLPLSVASFAVWIMVFVSALVFSEELRRNHDEKRFGR